MDALRRQRYLDALGIEVWSRRGAAKAEITPNVAVETARETVAPTQQTAERVEIPSPDSPPRPTIPQDWDGLQCAVRECTACALSQTRTNTVFGVGPQDAPLMVIGEGPGADEDARGEPFVGRAGQLLDQMLAAIGCSRERNVFVANVVKCRPPGNRDPRPEEAEACRGYLEQQIKIIQPRLLLALGRVAAQRLLDTGEPLAKLRENLHRYGPENTPLLVTYHPAYLLRSPREKAKSWSDLKTVARHLEQASE